MKTMIKQILFLVVIASVFSACSGPERSPAAVFMPDMYYSIAYEPYQKATFGYPNYKSDSTVTLFNENFEMSALLPANGTVARNSLGVLPYDLPDNNDGYQAAMQYKSPLDSLEREKNLSRGEKLYNQTCVACHGVKGDGQGSIVVTGAYLGVPNYKDRDITVGSVYHVIMYGRNAMGSFSSHFNIEDRWKVAEYVMHLKNNN